MRMRISNHLIAYLTFLLSIPILGSGIWLSSRASAINCLCFLHWPIIIIGISLIVISLAAFAGACYKNTILMYVHVGGMFVIIFVVIVLMAYAYRVTGGGSGRPVANRAYKDYSLKDYFGGLVDRVSRQSYWSKIAYCLRDSHACRRMERNIEGMPEPAELFYLRKLNPIESGCCKPPTSCGYVYINETVWAPGDGPVGSDPDCLRWNNDQAQLCYACSSCKAGVVDSVKHGWMKVSVINIVALSILVVLFFIYLSTAQQQ